MVNPGDIGAAGRNVRCGKCSHQWLERPEAAAIAESAEIAGEMRENLREAAKQNAKSSPRLPAVLKSPGPPMWLKAATGAAITASIALQCYFGGYFAEDVSGLAISGYNLTPSKEGDSFTLEWGVVNNGKIPRNLPARKISMLDEKSEVLSSSFMEAKPDIIKPGKKYDFTGINIKNNSKKGRYVVVEIGSSMDLSLR